MKLVELRLLSKRWIILRPHQGTEPEQGVAVARGTEWKPFQVENKERRKRRRRGKQSRHNCGDLQRKGRRNVVLSNIMHHRSPRRPCWFTSFKGLKINTNLWKEKVKSPTPLPFFGKLFPSVDPNIKEIFDSTVKLHVVNPVCEHPCRSPGGF